MTAWIPGAPPPPLWHLDWDALDRAHGWIHAMRDCRQDPEYHAEGDVWIHTRMVCESLLALPAWQTLSDEHRHLLITAALLHDVAKPDCTRFVDGRLTSRGHAGRGAILARRILWELAVPMETREQVTSVVAAHQVPFWLLERDDPARLAYAISQGVRCDLVAMLAEADARGRTCADQVRLLESVELFREFCREHECLDQARAFACDYSRFLYFQLEGRDPNYAAHDDTRFEVVLMSGLPAAGKDTWLRQNLAEWPVISLDAIRHETGISPTEHQGPVVDRAREQARVFLRQGTSFAWNATNLSRRLRAPLISFFAGYGARVRIVYVETSPHELQARNGRRERPVPWSAIEGMLDNWEVPRPMEAHAVQWVHTDPQGAGKVP